MTRQRCQWATRPRRHPPIYVVKSTTKAAHKSYQYAYLRYDEWDEAKARTQPRNLVSLGPVDKLEPERLESFGGFLREWLRKDSTLPFEALKERLKDSEPVFKTLLSKDFGLRLIFEQAWAELGYKEVIEEIAAASSRKFRVDVAIFVMVLAAVLKPQSKLAQARWALHSVFLPEAEGLNESHLYKAMDVLAASYPRVEAKLTEQLRKLGIETKRLVHDTSSATTWVRYDDVERKAIEERRQASGEAVRRAVVNDPPLRMRGKSKAHRPDLPQTLLSSVAGDHGLVVHHKTYAGNTSDRKVVEPALKRLEALGYTQQSIDWAGDTGTNSAANRKLFRNTSFHFVLGEGIERTKVVRKVLATPGRYHPHPDRPELLYKCVVREAEEERDKKAKTPGPDRLYIVRWNKDEEACALHRLECHLKEIREVLATDDPKAAAKLLRTPHLRKYVKRDGRSANGRVILNRKAIRKARKLAGKSVIATDDLGADPIHEDDIYRGLADLERLWSQLKTDLGLRPTRHRRADRIDAHHMIAIMAANLARWIERKCGLTIERLRQVFENVRVQQIQINNGVTFWECVDLEPEQLEILAKLGYDPPLKRFTATLV